MNINRMNQVFKEHFGYVSHDFRRGMTAEMIRDLGELEVQRKKIEELAAEIVADQERAGRGTGGN